MAVAPGDIDAATVARPQNGAGDCDGGTALTVLNLDSVPSPEVIAEITREKDIHGVKVAKL